MKNPTAACLFGYTQPPAQLTYSVADEIREATVCWPLDLSGWPDSFVGCMCEEGGVGTVLTGEAGALSGKSPPTPLLLCVPSSRSWVEVSEKGHFGHFCSVCSPCGPVHILHACKGVSSLWGTFHPLLVLKAFLPSRDSPLQSPDGVFSPKFQAEGRTFHSA